LCQIAVYIREHSVNIDTDCCIIKNLKEVYFIGAFANIYNIGQKAIVCDQFSIGIFEECKKEIGNVNIANPVAERPKY
jgi:hypothetical protein